MTLYELIITDEELCYEGYSADFFIGIFADKQRAEAIAAHYLKNVSGFCEYPCSYKINERTAPDGAEELWLAQGWNVNENLDETEIVQSEYLADKSRAETELSKMQKICPRTEWALSRYKIGECLCSEGFVRV